MKLSVTILLLLISVVSHSQILNPVKFSMEIPKRTLLSGEIIEIVFKASIQKDWHVYSFGYDTACGPLPFKIKLKKDASFDLTGGLVAIDDKPMHDKTFDCDVRFFETQGEVRQKIKVLSPKLNLVGTYEGQAWSEAGKYQNTWVLFDGDLSLNALKK